MSSFLDNIFILPQKKLILQYFYTFFVIEKGHIFLYCFVYYR